MEKRILVTGASGNLGGKVVNELLLQQIPIRAAGRNTGMLAKFKQTAEIFAGDLEDEKFLGKVLANITTVFLILPELKRLTLEEFAGLFIHKAIENNIKYIVNISNATLTRLGKPTSLIEFENYLNNTNNAEELNIKHLRCANFFENLNCGIHTPYKGSIKLPYISSYEVAAIASDYLLNLNFTGKSFDELMGKKDYSMKDFTGMLGVEYKQLPVPPEHEFFFNAFNTGQYELVKRTTENTSNRDEEKFSLEYFLKNDFNREVLK